MVASTGSERHAARHRPLEQLTQRELDLLNALAFTESHSAGKVIFRKGDLGDSMMSIVEGRVKISVSSPDGKELVIAVLGPGEVLGEMAVLGGNVRSADATVLDSCKLLVLDKSDLITILEINPMICIRLLHIMSERLRRTNALVEDHAFRSLPARLDKR